MRYAVVVLLLALVAGSCAVDTNQFTAATWRQMDVTTLEFELIDDTVVEALAFRPNGLVLATLGRRQGPMTTPLLYWRIDDESISLVH